MGRIDVYGHLAALLDGIFMFFYKHVYHNARRITRLAIAFLPLMMLLVGSCKTSEAPAAYGSNAGPEQFRTALFPDRVNFTGDAYYPAAGYIDRARRYVSGSPEAIEFLTGTEIAYLFGEPGMERHDADARVWQYQTENCTVDFFFYGEAGGSTVSYVDYRLRQGDGSVSGKDCLNDMAANRGVKSPA